MVVHLLHERPHRFSLSRMRDMRPPGGTIELSSADWARPQGTTKKFTVGISERNPGWGSEKAYGLIVMGTAREGTMSEE